MFENLEKLPYLLSFISFVGSNIYSRLFSLFIWTCVRLLMGAHVCLASESFIAVTTLVGPTVGMNVHMVVQILLIDQNPTTLCTWVKLSFCKLFNLFYFIRVKISNVCFVGVTSCELDVTVLALQLIWSPEGFIAILKKETSHIKHQPMFIPYCVLGVQTGAVVSVVDYGQRGPWFKNWPGPRSLCHIYPLLSTG